MERTDKGTSEKIERVGKTNRGAGRQSLKEVEETRNKEKERRKEKRSRVAPNTVAFQ